MAKTSLIGLTLPATGTLSGQWGDTVNNAISQIVDVAVAGTQTITVDTDIDLAVTEGTYASTGLTANSSQYAVLLCTGARTAARNINTPKQSKTYVVINDTTGGFAVTVRGGPTSPTTGVSVAAGTRAILAWNGSDFVNVGGGSAAGSNTQFSCVQAHVQRLVISTPPSRVRPMLSSTIRQAVMQSRCVVALHLLQRVCL